jgi:hypothetical protein
MCISVSYDVRYLMRHTCMTFTAGPGPGPYTGNWKQTCLVPKSGMRYKRRIYLNLSPMLEAKYEMVLLKDENTEFGGMFLNSAPERPLQSPQWWNWRSPKDKEYRSRAGCSHRDLICALCSAFASESRWKPARTVAASAALGGALYRGSRQSSFAIGSGHFGEVYSLRDGEGRSTGLDVKISKGASSLDSLEAAAVLAGYKLPD